MKQSDRGSCATSRLNEITACTYPASGNCPARLTTPPILSSCQYPVSFYPRDNPNIDIHFADFTLSTPPAQCGEAFPVSKKNIYFFIVIVLFTVF